MTISCNQSQSIEFLGFKGCPNTPILLKRLRDASPKIRITEVDLKKLKTGDPRLGWGAPTILLNGEDLFGVSPTLDGAVCCRNWTKGLPKVSEIKKVIMEKQQ